MCLEDLVVTINVNATQQTCEVVVSHLNRFTSLVGDYRPNLIETMDQMHARYYSFVLIVSKTWPLLLQ